MIKLRKIFSTLMASLIGPVVSGQLVGETLLPLPDTDQVEVEQDSRQGHCSGHHHLQHCAADHVRPVVGSVYLSVIFTTDF